MAGILDSVNQRTQLVGQNRLELLLFRLQTKQIYGINVFKVKEVLQCPKLTLIPQRHPVIRGLAHIRGGTIPIMDMGLAIGQRPIPEEDIYNSFVIITEYNRKTQGFLVGGVERIVNLNWEEIHPPPKGAGKENYLTAVTEIDKKLTEIIDVEKILAEVAPIEESLDSAFVEKASEKTAGSENKTVLVVDDSVVARKQIQNCLQTIGLNVITQKDGLQAYNYLLDLLDEGKDLASEIALMISDVEMPEMDGYTLTAKCKNDPRFDGLYIMLHTSLSGVFNKAMVQKVGADDFMAKFSPDELAERVMEIIDSRSRVV
ncbi:MAG: chemotaxis protein CheW [Oleiphilus sp.]|nr:MAG: chemotaxis protein CheW [Oleiphilus sp.]